MSSVYSNYIKRMRMCANENCKGCTYAYEGLTNTEECKEDLLYDAAEQLEDADKCNARLVKKCKEMEKRIAELEAQLPKEGEWIDEQPTVDVVPVVHGEWIFNGRFAELNHYACSNCNRTEFRMSDYCPNCGAKMKGEETDDGIHVRE